MYCIALLYNINIILYVFIVFIIFSDFIPCIYCFIYLFTCESFGSKMGDYTNVSKK